MIRNSINDDPTTGPDPEVFTPAQVNSQAQAAASPEPNEHPSVLLDVLAAPFRGVEDAARNTYGLVDFLTADSLPNWDKNFLGKSQTTAGSIVEGVANFLTAFIPVVGVTGKIGQGLGLVGKAAAFVNASAAGAIADFAAFDGHEERLSNLIQEHPSLANPVTDFLSAKNDDSFAVARLKNAVEGLGLGALSEAVLPALRAVGAVRKVKAGEISAEAAKKVIAEAEPTVGGALAAAKPVPNYRFTESATEGLDGIAKVVADFDPATVEGASVFQFPKKSLARVIDAEPDLLSLIGKTSESIRMKAGKGLEAVESRQQFESEVTQRLSDLSGSSPEVVLSSLRAREAVMQDSVYWGEAAARLMVASAHEANFYAKAASSGVAAEGLTMEQTILHSLKAQEVLANLVSITKGFGTIEGRALNSRKFIKSAQIEAQDVARQMVEQFGGADFVSAQLRKVALAGNQTNSMEAAKGVADLIRKQVSMGDRLMRAHNEYWINAVLSGTKTSFVNAMGNTMTTLFQPLEQAIGSAFQMDGKAVRASLKNYVYLAHSVQDAWKFASRSFIENENALLPSSAVNDLAKGPAIDASKLIKGGSASEGIAASARGLASGENLLSHFINFTGETVRMPQRFLLASDEFYKQLNYRAAAKTELYYRGLNKGLEGGQLASFVSDSFSRTVTEGGARYSEDAVIRSAYKQAEAQGLTGKARSDFIRDFRDKNWDTNNSALKDAFDVANLAQGVAEEATFTAPLGALGKGVQSFASSHPLFQLFMPFVRTPTNIVKYFGQRGLGALTFMPGVSKLQSRNLAELGSADALVRSRAMGRIATGQMAVSMAALGALNGNLTGSGPRDPNERKLLLATGWQPYSIKIETAEGPHYVSYQRLDPLATFLGTVADWSEQAKRQDPWANDALQTTLTAMAVSVSNNVTNKTYLASLAQVIDAINQPDRKFMAFTRARVGSYVPSLMAQWNSSLDDGQTMREVRGFFDGAINRIPGAQGMLESKRNVLGETIDSPLAQTPLSWVNPITLSKEKNDKVFTELAQFGHGIQSPNPVQFGAINLLGEKYRTAQGGTAYDRWQQLTGEATVGGRTLRQALEKLIDAPAYQKLPLTSPGDGYDSPRLSEVKKLILGYRKVAFSQLQKEIPSVAADVRSYQQGQVALRRGDKASALAQVQNVISSAQ